MALVRAIALSLAAALAAGACGAGPEAPAVDVHRDGAPGTLEAIEEKLAELERRLAEARTAIRTARETKERALQKIAELEATGRELRRQLAQARRSGTRRWTDLGRAIDRALVEVEAATGLSED